MDCKKEQDKEKKIGLTKKGGKEVNNKKTKTYSTRDSLVVTHPTTSLVIRGLSMGERTGSRVFHYLWPYVVFCRDVVGY